MLQIIGWLGCFYLVVKALEIAFSANFKKQDGRVTDAGAGIAALAILGALAFSLAFLLQGAEFSSLGSPQVAETLAPIPEELASSECLEKAQTTDEMTKCLSP